MFGQMTAARARVLAEALVNGTVNFARHEGARGAGAKTKTWLTTGDNPRPSHADVHGQSVGIDDVFEVGGRRGRWPHDHTLGPDEIAGCTCILRFEL